MRLKYEVTRISRPIRSPIWTNDFVEFYYWDKEHRSEYKTRDINAQREITSQFCVEMSYLNITLISSFILANLFYETFE